MPEGSVFGYLGPNGAGKTTTLHLLLGILPPTSGSAHVAGIEVAQRPQDVRRRCGAVLEHNGLYERLTAWDNLEFQGRMHGMPRADREHRIHEELERLGLWDRRHDPVGTWSRGMKQQLAIARAMLHRPQVLFLDEPTAGFDPKAAVELRTLIRALAKDGTTVFLTTHNLHEAEQVCDQVAVLRAGRLLATGTPGRLTKGPVGVEVACGQVPAKTLAAIQGLPGVESAQPAPGGLAIVLTDPSGQVAPIVQLLVRGGVAVEEVRRARQDLERDFLALVEAA